MTDEQLHHLLLDNLSTAVLLLNDSLEICYLNPSAENLLAVSAMRLCGNSVSTLFTENDSPTPSLREALESNHPFTQRQATMVLPDQSQITVDFTATPLQTSVTRMLVLEMQQMDRLMRINREEALITTHDTTRNLVRGLAHEIKNPLGGIRGAAQLLSEDLGDEPELREYTDIISAETDRLCSLVDRLLGPTTMPKFVPVNIHEVLEHVAALAEAETRGAIAIKRSYDPSIPEISGDRGQLIQAVLNIVRNSIQALRNSNQKRPTIKLVTKIQRHFTIGKVHHKVICRIDIIDNGPGIPEDLIDRIFFPMISGRAEGSGLGLPIAQSAINLHHGLIECENGKGETRFTIYLPLDI
ncbi:nitrogen regulation protein NR(II) [Porticoccus litoralis]|uniref:Sensory histidine kinase/phosphatase NtrB n=1 Tax=Porticoccus litoralis TaxID=434086 RepID=A0AAW8B2F6_9GAMM|nr:nitrogen regulation protein NR(II) [Porticoccus litoralis]MDP1520087.1 nitrogen regulation protein NR(II) [Porticoccus litoralis]TNE91370.1 MAG: PAS domain-containing protein [Gammaproteobacteria bacterium]